MLKPIISAKESVNGRLRVCRWLEGLVNPFTEITVGNNLNKNNFHHRRVELELIVSSVTIYLCMQVTYRIYYLLISVSCLHVRDEWICCLSFKSIALFDEIFKEMVKPKYLSSSSFFFRPPPLLFITVVYWVNIYVPFSNLHTFLGPTDACRNIFSYKSYVQLLLPFVYARHVIEDWRIEYFLNCSN